MYVCLVLLVSAKNVVFSFSCRRLGFEEAFFGLFFRSLEDLTMLYWCYCFHQQEHKKGILEI
jgi:hypothetical protein